MTVQTAYCWNCDATVEVAEGKCWECCAVLGRVIDRSEDIGPGVVAATLPVELATERVPGASGASTLAGNPQAGAAAPVSTAAEREPSFPANTLTGRSAA